MATTCGFGQIPDLRFKTLCCFGRVVIDRNCNLSVPHANIDNSLNVDVGGNVNMPYTTINFRNSTIDFAGASITGFTGNIEGNLTVTNLQILGNIYAQGVIANTVCATNLKGDLTGDVTGDLCGNIQTAGISAKSESIKVTGNLIGSLVGNLFGSSIGTHCGPVITSSITEKVSGDGITVVGNLDGFHKGTFCGDVLTSSVTEKTPGGGINFVGDVTMDTLTVNSFSGDLVGSFCGNVSTGNISPKPGQINITVNIPFGGIFDIPLGQINATAAAFDSLEINSFAPGFGDTIMLQNGSLSVEGSVIAANVCSSNARHDIIGPKDTDTGITMLGTVNGSYLVFDNICVGNITIKGNINPNIANLVVHTFYGNLIGTFCGDVATTRIREKVDMGGIQIYGNVNMANCVTAVDFIGNLKTDTITGYFDNGINMVGAVTMQNTLNVTGVVTFSSNLIVDQITALSGGDIDVYGNIILHSSFVGDLYAPSKLRVGSFPVNAVPFVTDGLGRIGTDIDGGDPTNSFTYVASTSTLNIPTGGTITIGGAGIGVGTSFASTRILYGDGTSTPATEADFTYNGGTNTLTIANNGKISLTGGTSQLSIAALTAGRMVFVGTSNELTDDSSFTYNSSTNVLNLPIGGALSVNSTQVVADQQTAVTDAAAATASSLTAGIGTANQTLQSIAGTGADAALNNNFEDCVDEINKLITDVADIRSQFNSLLSKLRTHGLIAT